MEIKDGSVKVRTWTLKYSEMSVADTTFYWDLILPGEDGGYLTNFFGRVTTAFAGVTNPHVKVGDPGILDSIMQNQPIGHTGVLATGGPQAAQFGCAKMDTVICDLVAPKIRVTVSSTTGNLSALTAGELEFLAVYAI
uniref:Uncharacterized protein n=1 Tax=viral metagenome TaxID=1070528 RepID=A0A6H1ZVB8_9ZZZZ